MQVPMMLGAGEVAYAVSSAQVLQRTAETVNYQHSSMFAFGRPAFMVGAFAANAMMNRSARQRAERAAAAQWRWRDSGHLFLTNQRLALQGSLSWADFWFGALRSVNTDHLSLMMYLDGCPPTALRCPSPGWWYVALHWLIYGSVPSISVPADLLERAAAIRDAANGNVLERPRPTEG
ncbi:MAG TPA: hypothetical protein VFJ85_19880 [Acidimicrobiales bacterium]|nr:hypothetical protein [Acidimicrobiales bacterium]